MNSIFLRIYGGMLAALVLVALLGVGALHLVNEVRADQYRESLARGTFRLMADNLLPMNQVERRRALVVWSRLLGIPLELQAMSDVALESRERNRLQRGHVLVQQTGPHSARVYGLLDGKQPLLLTGEIQQVSEQLARATNYLLIDELVRYPVDEQPRRLAELKEDKQFGFDLQLVQLEDASIDLDQRRRIDEGDTVMALGKGGDSIYVFSGIVDTPWVLEIGPLYQMNPYPPQLLVLIGALGLSLIGLIVYLLVRSLEQRLRGLEGAATRIASGRLDARVPALGADSVGRLASSFNAMAEHLQTSLSTQRELVRAVSHELRTPVARLRFGLEMLADCESAEERRDKLNALDKDIDQLDRLIDEILTYARLEEGTPNIEFQPVYVREICEQLVAELDGIRGEIAVEVAGAEDLTLDGDPRYLHRILQNLVTNALRYANSRVRMTLSEEGDRVVLDVDDDGKGIPEHQRERVFKPFARLDKSRHRASGGYGLGLSIVKRVVDWHGGAIQISESEWGGARFRVILPRHQQKQHVLGRRRGLQQSG